MTSTRNTATIMANNNRPGQRPNLPLCGIALTNEHFEALCNAYPANVDSHGELYLFGWQVKTVVPQYENTTQRVDFDKAIYLIAQNPVRLIYKHNDISGMRADVRWHSEDTADNERLIRIFDGGSKESRLVGGTYYLTGAELKALGYKAYGLLGNANIKDESIYNFPSQYSSLDVISGTGFSTGRSASGLGLSWDTVDDMVCELTRVNDWHEEHKRIYKVLDKQLERKCKENKTSGD